MRRTALQTAITLALLAWPAFAWAAPDLKVSVRAETEIAIDDNGNARVERLPARNVKPGDEVIYTITYSNAGDATASNVVIEDPIPANGVYIEGSNFAPAADSSFSIDGGKHFDTPERLFASVQSGEGETVEVVAGPESYTHIRWVLDEIRAGETGHASFRVRVKGVPDGGPAQEQVSETEALPAVSPLAAETEALPAVSPLAGESQMFVQVGAFASMENAMQLRSSLAGLFPSAHIASSAWKERQLYRVRIGPFADTQQIEHTVTELHQHGQETVIVTESLSQ